jgi:hypothetical protein
VELECFLGYALLSILLAKGVVKHIVETSFSNSVSSTIVFVDNRVELEVENPGM